MNKCIYPECERLVKFLFQKAELPYAKQMYICNFHFVDKMDFMILSNGWTLLQTFDDTVPPINKKEGDK